MDQNRGVRSGVGVGSDASSGCSAEYMRGCDRAIVWSEHNNTGTHKVVSVCRLANDVLLMVVIRLCDKSLQHNTTL